MLAGNRIGLTTILLRPPLSKEEFISTQFVRYVENFVIRRLRRRGQWPAAEAVAAALDAMPDPRSPWVRAVTWGGLLSLAGGLVALWRWKRLVTAITGRTRIVGVWGHPGRPLPLAGDAQRRPRRPGPGLGLCAVRCRPRTTARRRRRACAPWTWSASTSPCRTKKPSCRLLDVVDEDARRIGSVNTIHNVGGVLHGSSTDGPGFLRTLEALGEPADGRRALILGAGGSARAVAFALAGAGRAGADRQPDRGAGAGTGRPAERVLSRRGVGRGVGGRGGRVRPARQHDVARHGPPGRRHARPAAGRA